MNTLDREGRSDLHYAARDSDIAAVRALIAGGADVNLQDKRGWTPLHFAAQARSGDVATYLLEQGSLVDSIDVNGNTPLSVATFSSRGDGTVIRILRAAGADPERKNASGVSAVTLAQTIANYDVVQFFNDLSES